MEIMAGTEPTCLSYKAEYPGDLGKTRLTSVPPDSFTAQIRRLRQTAFCQTLFFAADIRCQPSGCDEHDLAE